MSSDEISITQEELNRMLSAQKSVEKKPLNVVSAEMTQKIKKAISDLPNVDMELLHVTVKQYEVDALYAK